MSEEWKSRAQKPADFCWGTCLGISRGAPEVWARLAYVSFLPHDLVTGGIPHTGSRHCSPWMGSRRVRHAWATSLSLFTFMHWRRKWQPTPIFLPGESQEWGSMVGYSPQCQEPAWGIPPVTMSRSRDLMGKVESDLRFSPWHFLSMFPENQNLPAFVLCFSTLLTHSGKSHLKALVFCIWKGVSIQKPLWWLSSLPAGLVQLRMWLFAVCRLREAQEA